MRSRIYILALAAALACTGCSASDGTADDSRLRTQETGAEIRTDAVHPTEPVQAAPDAPVQPDGGETAHTLSGAEQQAAREVLETQPPAQLAYEQRRNEDLPQYEKLRIACAEDVNWLVGSIEQRFYELPDPAAQASLVTLAAQEAAGVQVRAQDLVSGEDGTEYRGEDLSVRYDAQAQSLCLRTPSLCDREIREETCYDGAPEQTVITGTDDKGQTTQWVELSYPLNPETVLHLQDGDLALWEIETFAFNALNGKEGADGVPGIPQSFLPAPEGMQPVTGYYPRTVTVRTYADGTQGVTLCYTVTLRDMPVTPYIAADTTDTAVEGTQITVGMERTGRVDSFRVNCVGLPAAYTELTRPADKDYLEGKPLLSLEEACRIADDHLTQEKCAVHIRLQYAVLALREEGVLQGRVLTPVWQFEFFQSDPYSDPVRYGTWEKGGFLFDVDAITGQVYAWEGA